jgi:hypothetical protein
MPDLNASSLFHNSFRETLTAYHEWRTILHPMAAWVRDRARSNETSV